MEGEHMRNGGEEVKEPQATLQNPVNENEIGGRHIGVVAGVELAGEANSALRVKKLSPQAVLPSRGSALAAGYDQPASRSGLALKHSIDVGAGVIDADYRGPVGVILFNHSDTDFTIKAGDRIAQLILQLIVMPQVLEVEDLDMTTHGEGGFGSTGNMSLVVNP